MKDEFPDYLSEQARNVYVRVSNNLKWRGLWKEAFSGPLSITSMTCAAYVTKAKSNSVSDYDLEALRIATRGLLSDFLVIPRTRVNFSVMNSAGIDRDILELCTIGRVA